MYENFYQKTLWLNHLTSVDFNYFGFCDQSHAVRIDPPLMEKWSGKSSGCIPKWLLIRKYPQSGQLIWICIQLYPQSFVVFIVVVFVVIFSLSLSSSSLSSLLGRHLMGPTVIFAREILAAVKFTTWLRQFSSNQCLMLLFRHSFTTCLEKQCLSLWQSRCSILWVEEGASPSENS